MPGVPETRASLILRLPRTEDAEAWREFVAIYEPFVYRFARRSGFQEADARELVQNVLLAVVKAVGRWQADPERARFRTWLFTIARNLVIDQRRKRTMSSLDEIFESNADDDRGRSFEAADDDPTPFDRLSNLEDRERIAGALMQIDTLHREVLVLRFHEDLSLEEIAKVTRAPLSTVKSRLYRGMAALKPKIEKAALRRLEAI